MELLNPGKICESCGSALDVEMPSGFCPGCLLNTVLKPASQTPVGTRIDDYELLDEVARGGMGIVYRARQRTPSRIVALKMILPVHLNSRGAVSRFRMEAEAAASLDHEGILPIYAVGEREGASFYSMKFAEGGALSARIDNYRDKPRDAAALIAKLARAVAFAHEHGILHRDLKPANVLFDAADKPYVSDFGLAKWLTRESDLTQTFAVLGTPFYMAPEQASDSRAVTPAADIYSLGAILYHLLEGRPPVEGETPMQVLHRAAERMPRFSSRTPRDLATICLKCLEKQPGARYSNADALALDLGNFCADSPVHARRAGLMRRTWRWSRRNPVLAELIATTALLVLSVGTLLWNIRRPAAVTALPDKSIAVLPFRSFGDDKENAYLADGVQDNILTDLTKVMDLKVISRRSVAQYHDTEQSASNIGQALQVRYLLEGAVRKAGGRIYVTTQLVDTRTGTERWAEKYERDVADIFLIQSDIAQEVVTQLKGELSPGEKKAIETKPTQDMEAYDLYLRARSLFARREVKNTKADEEDANKATELLEAAIAREPKFTLAYCALADVQLYSQVVGSLDQSWRDKAKRAIDAALQISPESPEVHLARASYFIHGIDDPAAGEKDLAIAAAALPGRLTVFDLRAAVEEQRGEWKAALRDRERVLELDPRGPESARDLINLYIALRWYSRAERLADHMIAVLPKESVPVFWRLKGYIALARGDPKVAMNAFDTSPLRHAGLMALNFIISDVFIMQRDYPEAEQIFQTMSAPGKTPYVIPKAAEAGMQLLGRGMALERLGRIARFRGEREKSRTCFEAARPHFEEWLARDSGQTRWLDAHIPALIAEVDAGSGRKEQAIREGLKAVEMWPLQRDARIAPNIKAYLAITYLWSGEREAALQQLAELSKTPLWLPGPGHRWPVIPGLTAGELKLNPLWDELRRDSRFQKLIVETAKPISL